MGFSVKYSLEGITSYSVTGWNGVLSTNIQKIDHFLNTYVEVILAETIAKYDAIALNREGRGIKAQADGVKQPSLGLAIEAGDAEDTVRVKRCGPITNTDWAWSAVGKPIYLSDGVAGGLTQFWPLIDQQIIGTVLALDTIFLDIFYDIAKSTRVMATTTTSTTSSSSSTSVSTTTTTTLSTTSSSTTTA